MKVAASFGLGVLFALGLGVSRMSQPSVVLGFLDFAGAWNPALLFVMLSAIPIYLLAWKLKPAGPVLGGAWPAKVRHDLDRQLLLGAGIFGVGWGLAGVCPGPAIVILGRPTVGAVIFITCMVAGMLAYRMFTAKAASNPA